MHLESRRPHDQQGHDSDCNDIVLRQTLLPEFLVPLKERDLRRKMLSIAAGIEGPGRRRWIALESVVVAPPPVAKAEPDVRWVAIRTAGDLPWEGRRRGDHQHRAKVRIPDLGDYDLECRIEDLLPRQHGRISEIAAKPRHLEVACQQVRSPSLGLRLARLDVGVHIGPQHHGTGVRPIEEAAVVAPQQAGRSFPVIPGPRLVRVLRVGTQERQVHHRAVRRARRPRPIRIGSGFHLGHPWTACISDHRLDPARNLSRQGTASRATEDSAN